MVKTITKDLPIRKVGTSLYLLLDKNIRDCLEIKPGLILRCQLTNLEVKPIEVICPRCKNTFMVDDKEEILDCNICDAEITESDKEVINE